MNATMSAGTDRRPRADTQRAGSALPRVLAGVRDGAHLTLAQHDAVHGPLPAVRGRGRRHAREGAARMIEEIAQSGLRGHGGAAFPVATKMHAVANARGRAIVVANATEGEPASLKDRTLLELLPHLVLDGGVLAAEALGADRLLVCVCDSSASAYEAATHALAERADHNESGVQVELVRTPRHYVAGQESALVNFLNGGPALPTFTPPMVFERGVARRPTLVNNAETLAHMALIARHGAAWFRELGTASQPGSALVTVSGPVVHPGVYEVEHGSSLASLIDACGGASVRLRGALIGGYAGTWIGEQHLRTAALSNDHLAAHGATLGAGVVVLLSERACPVAETARAARWMADQSARQCGPCLNGLYALADTVAELVRGEAGPTAGKRIDRLASLVARRGACGHPDGAVNMILSATEAFAEDFSRHSQHGPCELCSRPAELPLPARPVDRDARRGAEGAR